MGIHLPHALPDNDYYTSDVWKARGDVNYSISVLTKALARTVCGKCGIWWFGMFDRWFTDDKLMDIISKTEKVYNAQQKDYLKADVCVFVDEKSYKYYSGIPENKMHNAICTNMSNLSHAGFSYHIYLLSDIKDDKFPANDYKMFVFV